MANILLTIDVEDWFQVENFKPWIPFSTWSYRELRLEKNTHKLLDLFDLCNSTRSPIRATFFMLGWVAERFPDLVREINDRGHEVASHGYYHNLCDQQSFGELKKDLKDSKKLIEDIIGTSVIGYRAPSFAINNDILKIIEDCGYLYDSSYNSFRLHRRYGHVDFSQNDRKGMAIQISDPRSLTSDHRFYELPVSNLKFLPQNSKPKIKNPIFDLQFSIFDLQFSIFNLQSLELPWSGGGYFRLIPFSIFKRGVEAILKEKNAYLFYIHPWEIDPDQPRVEKASLLFKVKHYTNLNSTHLKLLKLIKNFQQHAFITCRQYLEMETDNKLVSIHK